MGAGASRRPARPGARTLVLAVDDSPEAAVALSWVRANVLRPSDSLALVHVHDPGVGEEQARRQVAKFEELCRAHGIPHRVLLAPGVRGKTASVLATTADSVHAHIVVIGCRTMGAMKRAFVGSVSSKLAATSTCPVMVIKKPPPEAGAFLTVVPRRVCLHIDGTQHAHSAFLWALSHLLAPEMDDVYLLCCTRRKGNVASWLNPRRFAPLLDEHGSAAEIAHVAETCEELCIKAGFNVTKVFVRDSPPSSATGQNSPASSGYIRWSESSSRELIRHATQASCNLLVVSRESEGCKMARQAPFPVVVVGAQSLEGAGDVSVARSVSCSSHSSGRGPGMDAFDIGENSDEDHDAGEDDSEGERERERERQRQIQQENVYNIYKERQARASVTPSVSVSG